MAFKFQEESAGGCQRILIHREWISERLGYALCYLGCGPGPVDHRRRISKSAAKPFIWLGPLAAFHGRESRRVWSHTWPRILLTIQSLYDSENTDAKMHILGSEDGSEQGLIYFRILDSNRKLKILGRISTTKVRTALASSGVVL